MQRYYFKSSISEFLARSLQDILGHLTQQQAAAESQQHLAWREQILLLQRCLVGLTGTIVFEFSIPRMGKRVDCILIIDNRIYVIEFKIGAKHHDRHAIEQTMDYALDLKNFHAASHNVSLIPLLVCTGAQDVSINIKFHPDGIAETLLSNGQDLRAIIAAPLVNSSQAIINAEEWLHASYKPTPTIIEAAQALYRGHAVEEISRADSGAINLSRTSSVICEVIERSKRQQRKSICFVTGVPGAGKTLAGLNLANSWHDAENSQHAVFLSGNGPLVDVLREALARDKVCSEMDRGIKVKKAAVVSQTKAFVQNIHHFRDAALVDTEPPIERVVVFDEAQRAWTEKHTTAFMKTKKGRAAFNQSEPEFLIGVLDRHPDWATIICLVGGGQEINTGEAGIQEWFAALQKKYPHWDIYLSSQLADQEYVLGITPEALAKLNIQSHDDLHLAVSVRSFRSEKVALFVKQLLDGNTFAAQTTLRTVLVDYPIYLTRDFLKAKEWLRRQARGNERTGVTASSGAIRLKPFAIQVKSPIDPVNWFLNDKSDIRSSNFLEDVATEFMVQGLELDWSCVAWDGDLRYDGYDWTYMSFRGSKWQEVKDNDARRYLKNAYRVLLTRARQGMVIFVPEGDAIDPTRAPSYYDHTFRFLQQLGLPTL